MRVEPLLGVGQSRLSREPDAWPDSSSPGPSWNLFRSGCRHRGGEAVSTVALSAKLWPPLPGATGNSYVCSGRAHAGAPRAKRARRRAQACLVSPPRRCRLSDVAVETAVAAWAAARTAVHGFGDDKGEHQEDSNQNDDAEPPSCPQPRAGDGQRRFRLSTSAAFSAIPRACSVVTTCLERSLF